MKRSALHIELAYLAKHKLLFVAALLCRGVWEVVPMQVPLLAGVIVDGLTGKGLLLLGWAWPEATPQEVLQFAVLGLLAVAVVYCASAYAYTVAGALLDKKFVSDLRKAVVEKAMFLSLDHHQRYGSGEILDCALRDTDRLRGFTERVFTRTLTNIVRAGYPIAMLFLINPVLALIALSVVPPQWLATWYLQKRLHAATRKSLASHSDLTTGVQENLAGIETIQTLGAERSSVARLHEQAAQVEVDELAADRITALIRGTIWLMTGIGVALIWWQGGMRVLAGEMTLGMLVAFTGFAEFAYRPFRLFTNIVRTYRVGLASLERVQELLEVSSSVPQSSQARPIQIDAGRISFRDVSFSYGAEEALQGVSLEIGAGQFTAIVGPNGSGKSSLLRLMARLHDPDEGQVLIDGQPLEGATLESLRSQLAVVPQRPVVFSGTVVDNVRLARPDATTEEVRSACEAASALDFIERLENGFETRLGRQGVSLSGGEVQRLAIARALLNRPKVLLLDEPTAALDAGSEAIVVRTLLGLRGQMTLVLVGHRPQAVRHADRVVVMDAGRVVADGTHEDLLARSSAYQELFGAGEAVHAGAEQAVER
jgi:ABC-type multidrug transport system fused ATPase/permease subunit